MGGENVDFQRYVLIECSLIEVLETLDISKRPPSGVRASGKRLFSFVNS